LTLETIAFRYVSRSKLKLTLARLVYVLLRLLVGRDRLQITRGGIRYEVDISEGLDLALFLSGTFQGHITDPDFLHLPEDAVVLDVGANAGATTLRYACIAKKGRVYAFEPTESAFRRLNRNLSLNPDLARRVDVQRTFISDKTTSTPAIGAYASWDLKDHKHAHRARHPIHGGMPGVVDGVGAVTLDSFCAERRIDRVDLLKIDTDGHELAVLRGARRLLRELHPTVVFEVGLYLLEERGIGFETICDILEPLGYRMLNLKSGREVTRANYCGEIPRKATIDIVARPLPAVRPVSRVARKRVVVIGGGIAGLVAARRVAMNSDAEVLLIERDNTLGGLASSISLGEGHRVEKYYHFVCKPDRTYMRLMEELGIAERLRWKTSTMGLFYNGVLSPLSDPLTLVRFGPLSMRDKARFAFASAGFKWTSSSGWNGLENESVSEWLVRRYGKTTYDVLYEPLLRLKFREYADSVSAAWMWARLWRLAKSRTIAQRERIGYLDGGSQLFIDRLEADLRDRGVEIRTGVAVDAVVASDDRVSAVRCGDDGIDCDAVISTISAPLLRRLVAGFDQPYWEHLGELESIGVVVILMRLEKRFSPYFWMNISDPRIDLAGVIEYTNLNPCEHLGGDALVYVPQYVAQDHALFMAADRDLLERHARFMELINPDFDVSWVKDYWVHRDRFSQPICRIGFHSEIPSMRTPIVNMFVTDSHQLHPHDRSISGSSGLGERAARLVLDALRDTASSPAAASRAG
jgi:FkbM family methyltransferase